MKLTFDYYHNLEKVDLYLCNPDGRELFPLPGKSRNLALRFNDLSELTFEVDSKVTLSNGTVVDIDAYDYIQTKRLVYATNIGWFQISGVDEHDNGIVKYKSVTAESYQSVLKNKGFISEERVYCFYNPNDPHDDRYDSTKDDSIPSVLGQWSKQLGIKQALGQGLEEPATPYDDWTVTYVNPSLIYSGAGSKCRTFKENVTYGYDWIVNDVEEAFEVVILFDFMFKTIHVMAPNEVAQRVNVIYTFNNFMKNVDIHEDSEDIVTVLNCNGDNCDITAVNPTGTNYICDFSYFMDKTNYRWMSAALIAKLEQWKAACDAEKDTYTNYVSQLRALWLEKTKCVTSLQEMSLSLQDLKNAQNKRSVVGSGTPGALCGIVAAENVQSGNKSIKSGTAYYSTAFTGEKTITAYQSSPTYDAANKRWVFSGSSKTGTANSIVASNLSDSNTSGVSYWYFSDVSDGSSYCKLQSAVTVNKDSTTSTYYCGGFDRYIAYSYPIVDESTGKTTYTDTIQSWINLRESLVNSLNTTDASLQANIDSVSAQLDAISSRLNILVYFANTPGLLRELNCYWIEGDYTNENIAVLEETTPEEEIDLANELLEAGYIELSKVCQPRFSFSLESIDATKQYEFKEQMKLLELGKIITIEKEEGLWYYPALLEIAINLDNSEEFTMAFANAMRLDDWGYTYADLISDASSTSRKVSANWQDILAYAKERETVTSLIRDPLDMTLRAAFANMVNQEFTVDKNGILGRKKVSETSDEFEDEQVRLINNLLIFTDDNWETAKTALGKIYYTDDDGNQVTSYGLIAETIIGSLIMGERLKIKNSDSTVELGAEGITIKKKNADNTYSVVFSAKPDGSLVVKGYATQESVDEVVSELNVAKEAISAKVSSTGGDKSSFAWSLTSSGFYLYSSSTSPVMSVTSSGAVFSGSLSAATGTFSGSLSAATGSFAGSLSAVTGTLGDLTITGRLKFGGDNSYYIDANYSDSSYYVNLPGLKIDKASGAVFSGKLSAATGTFSGSLSAATGSFSGSITSSSATITGGSITFGASNDKSYCSVNSMGLKAGVASYNTQINWAGITLTWNEYHNESALSYVYFGGYSNDGMTTSYGIHAVLDPAYHQHWVISCYGGTYGDTGYASILFYMHKTTYSSSYAQLYGTWKGELTASSDRNLKNSIEVLSDNYELLFDKLTPVRYKFNEGTSGRYHTGFIAQDVESAILSSGLTTEDAALFVRFETTNEKTRKDEITYGLRYHEFISLNTWQIQKLKARVAELEAIVAKLQEG